MNLDQQAAAIALTEDGSEVLSRVNVKTSKASVDVHIQDSDDLGIWIRVSREDGDHVVLLRWQYVLSIDLPVRETKKIGLKVD
jgi:hypothetical protein